MSERTVIEMTHGEFEAAVNAQAEVKAKQIIYECFEGRIIESSAACQILGISDNTLYKYIAENKVIPLKREGRKFKFHLPKLLTIDLCQDRNASPARVKNISK